MGWDVSVFEVAAGAALRAMDVTRVGARALRHPIQELEDLHQVTRPLRVRLRARQWQEQAQQLGQQGGYNRALPSGTVDGYDDQAGDVGGLQEGPSIADEAGLPVGDADGGGVLELVGNAVEWARDLFS
jgi:hypothetical protein